MSTPATPAPTTAASPGSFSQPATGWYPQLSGLNLNPALTNGITQSYSLIYSLRDAVSQLQATVNILATQLVQYGKDTARAHDNPQSVPNGALWFEINTGNVYQSRISQATGKTSWVQVLAGIPQPPGT